MDPQELSAQQLVQLCLSTRDHDAWQEFVRRYQQTIARVVTKMARRWTVPSPGLVDDLVQETYLKLFANNCRALREFDCQHENALFGFLKVIASNVVQDHFRSSYSQKRGSGRGEDSLDQENAAIPISHNSSDRIERTLRVHEVRRCLEAQSGEPNFARDYAIFWLYYQQGLTARAISELPGIGLTVKGVESTLLRLTRLVRARLGEPGRSSAAHGGP